MDKFNFPKEEEKILKFWQKEKIFEKTLEANKNKKNYSFYDGPPFATGKPHYGHILASAIKDTITRFFSQRGNYIERRLGWDCHGLPVEALVEKELGIKSKKEIERLGIDKFNSQCKKAVTRHVDDFKSVLSRFGRFADYNNDYHTMDKTYTETVWWILKKMDEAGLLFDDFRVTAYCPRCGTPLSNFEVNQGYKNIKEDSVYVLFRTKGPRLALPVGRQAARQEKNTYFLVWTTTPWTLPANLELAIGDFTYVKVKYGDKFIILAKDRLQVLSEKYEIIQELGKEDLLGLKYEPLYKEGINFKVGKGELNKAYKVYEAPFVNLEEGTGIVHVAPSFGEDDMELGKKTCQIMLVTVDEEGKNLAGPGKGKWVKDADEDIIKDLKNRGQLIRQQIVEHTYPFCWRCDTPLLYYPIKTFYLRTSRLKKQLVKNNECIHWVPGYLKKGRFGNWLAEAKDWAISRNRYWGAPLPIWQCQKCQHQEVIGSIKELEEKGVKVPPDLHRPYIDKVFYPCPKCKGKMKRIEEVFDCWFESGSMPYAQFHYPFENKNKTEKNFPADFIAEGLDQTRGWFYTLHAIATSLTLEDLGLDKNKPAFKNVVVNGIILAEDGKKLSKRLKNYPDPNEVFSQYGADSLRFFLISSSPLGENYRFSERLVRLIFQNIILRLYNSYLFFDYIAKTYKINKFSRPQKLDLMDRWIIERFNSCSKKVIELMEKYELVKAAREIKDFLADLSLWYIRRVKTTIIDKNSASAKLWVLHSVLKNLVVLLAPFLPYLSEFIYQKIRNTQDQQSVHLCSIEDKNNPQKKVLDQMFLLREAVSVLLELRAKNGIKVRQPLKSAVIPFTLSKEEEKILKDEINVKTVKKGKNYSLDIKLTQKLKEEGLMREFMRQIQELRKKLGYKYGEKATFFLIASKKTKQILKKNLTEISKKTRSDFVVKDTGKEIARISLEREEIKISQ